MNKCTFCGKSLPDGENCNCLFNEQPTNSQNEELCECCGEPVDDKVIVTCSEDKLCYYNCPSEELPLCLFEGICKFQTPQPVMDGE